MTDQYHNPNTTLVYIRRTTQTSSNQRFHIKQALNSSEQNKSSEFLIFETQKKKRSGIENIRAVDEKFLALLSLSRSTYASSRGAPDITYAGERLRVDDNSRPFIGGAAVAAGSIDRYLAHCQSTGSVTDFIRIY